MSDSFATLDFALGDTADAIRDTTRAPPPTASPLTATIDASNSFALELWVPMGELGSMMGGSPVA